MLLFFFLKQKTAYEMRISDWSSDVCSSDLTHRDRFQHQVHRAVPALGRDLVDRGAVAARGGIVEHDVDSACFCGGRVHQRLDVGGQGDVAAHEADRKSVV